MDNYNEWIGKKVSKIYTATGLELHTKTGKPCFTFAEDESIVECFRCKLS